MFGGISVMGLWYIDIAATLRNGGTFTSLWDDVSPIYPKRIYKLLAKKVFSTNLCEIRDSGTNGGLANTAQLDIRWNLYFI